MMAKHCITCMRGPQFAEGCSHMDCPHRRPCTAPPLQGIVGGSSTRVTEFRQQLDDISARGDE